ncbi:MAG: helix-turn-helix domain-containing protein [Clostridia bacterium]|nr:helix-turn-helix domain-containing protein [Clostridia bacterium]
MEDKIIYTVREVADILHTSPNYVYELVNNGHIPAIKLGSIRILKKSLIDFLSNNIGNDLSNMNDIKKLK